VVTALLLLWVLSAPGAFADTVAFTWSDSSITSPVGLATDHDHSLYWTANSTADKKNTSVYAVGTDGRVRATMTYTQSTTGVLAVGYDSHNLYALDKSTKTNTLRLAYMTLTSLVVNGSLAFHFYELVLPESGQTIVALIVAPNGQFYVVAQSGHIYKAPAKPSVAGINKLTKVSDGTAGTTGGFYDATTKSIVLRTASSIILADPASFATTSTIAAPAQTGARGITRALDGDSYLLVGQGNGNPVLSTGGSSASPSATPSDTSSPSASATVAPTETTTAPGATSTIHTDQLFGKGTVMALGGAFVLALLAGVAAFVRR
jgi:hypothetical protein